MLDLAYHILTEDAAVVAVSGDRIYPEYRDPGSNTPAIMMDLASMRALPTMSTTSKADSYTLKIWAFHQGVGAAVSFGRKVRAALEGQRGTFAMPDGYTYYLANTSVENFDVDTDYDGRTAAVMIEIEMDVLVDSATLGPGPDYPNPNPSLNELSDVNIPGVTDGQFIKYQASSGTWIPADGVTANFPIGDLSDVDTTGVTDGQYLSYNMASGEWLPIDNIDTLGELNDVSNAAPNLGDVLTYNTVSSEWEPTAPAAPVSALNDLTDVDTSGVVDGDVIAYDSASGDWLAVAQSGGSGNEPSNFTWVNSKADLPAAVSGVITLLQNNTYFFTGLVDLTGDRMVCENDVVILGPSSENARITSTGLTAGTPLLTTEYTLPMRHVTLQDVDTAYFIDGNANPPLALDWTGVNFENVPNIGMINTCDNFIFTKGAGLSSSNMKFSGTIGTIGIDNSIFVGTGSNANLIELDSACTVTRRFRMVYCSVVAFGATKGVDVDLTATIPTESFILDTINFSGGGNYLPGITDDSNSTRFSNCKGISNTSVNGQMYMRQNATATPILATNTFYKVEGVTTDSPDNAKFTMTDNRLTCAASVERKFLIQCALSFESGNNNQCEFGFYDSTFGGGSVRTPSVTRATAGSSGRTENLSFFCVTKMASGDYIEIHALNETSTTNITVTDMNVTVTEIQ